MSGRRTIHGRANWLTIAGVAGLAAIIFLFALTGESAQAVGTRFMAALAKGDVKTLTDISYAPGTEPEELEKQWDYAVNTAGKHYRFVYKIVTTSNANDETATVRMMVVRNVDSDQGYEEKFELPMVKKDGRWRVEIRSLDRRIFPQLPRG